MGAMRRFDTAMARKSYRVWTEDRADVFKCPAGTVAVVADGAGGRSGGAAAADAAVSLIRERLAEARHITAPDITALLRRIDADLLADPKAGQTTAVIAVVTERGVAGAAVGDSAAWLIGRHADRVLTRESKPFLGTGEAHPVPFGGWMPKGTLLLATDGLFGYVEAGDIVEAALRDDLDDAAAALAGLPRRENGMPPDDVAVVLIRRSPEAESTPRHNLSDRWRSLFHGR